MEKFQPNSNQIPIEKDKELELDKELDTKESRKEDIYNNLSSKSAGAREVDFSSMSDEELLDWWEEWNKKFEPTEENWLLGERYNEEIKKRQCGFLAWKGKPIIEDGVVQRMASYNEIVGRYFDEGTVVWNGIFDFIRHCNAGGRFVTNAKLDDLCFRLLEEYGTDEDRRQALQTAIRGGYYDVRGGRE